MPALLGAHSLIGTNSLREGQACLVHFTIEGSLLFGHKRTVATVKYDRIVGSETIRLGFKS